MCGLAGIFTADGSSRDELTERVTRMTDAIRHRGPDDEGQWVDADAGVGLGFRRLAIIDLSPRGHQPMRSPSGRYTLTFNGEIYNFQALRAQLAKAGRTFLGRSDTEVLVNGFEEWGIERTMRLANGMFAIAVWDAEERQLTLGRDRLGKKPVFYFARGGTILWGSELKALAADASFERSLNTSALASYLRYLYVPTPASIFQYVKKLPAASLLTIRDARAELPEPEPYWRLDEAARAGLADPLRGSDAEVRSEFEELLQDAVRIRLESDVPLGALLSGGVDSSTVVALMQRASSRPVRTFSIGFDSREHDESAHAAEVAACIGTEHTALHVGAAEALAVVPDLPQLFDEPLADPSQIPTFLVSRLARQHVTVALTGDGGDELFAGYNRYLAGERLIPRMLAIPGPMRRMAASVLAAVPEPRWDRTYRAFEPLLPGRMRHRLPGQKVAKMGRLFAAGSANEMYRSLLSANHQPAAYLPRGSADTGPVEEWLASSRELSFLQRAMLTDQATYLPDDLLAKVDRASMAVSLEVRVPILDYRLVEFSWRLPRQMKIRDGESKWLLRQVLYRQVPRPLVDRPKVGFSVPVAQWLRRDLRSWAEGHFMAPDPHGVLDTAELRKMWRRFDEGHTELALGLWAVLMLRAWMERWLN